MSIASMASMLQNAELALESVKHNSDELLHAMSNAEDPVSSAHLSASLAVSTSQQLAVLVQSWPQVQQILAGMSRKYDDGSLKRAFEDVQQSRAASRAADRVSAWCSTALEHLEQHLHQDYAPVISSTRIMPSMKAPASLRVADPEELSALVARVRQALPGLQLGCYASSGRGTAKSTLQAAEELRLMCPGVLCASIQLLGQGVPYPIKVFIDAADRAADVDSWGPQPLHHIFRRLTPLATRVMHYYLEHAPAAAELDGPPNKTPGSFALESLLLWLGCYQDLYTRPCVVTGSMLAVDNSSPVPMPPLFRPFKMSRQQLLEAATLPACRTAYHMHAVPRSLLDWHVQDLDA